MPLSICHLRHKTPVWKASPDHFANAPAHTNRRVQEFGRTLTCTFTSHPSRSKNWAAATQHNPHRMVSQSISPVHLLEESCSNASDLFASHSVPGLCPTAPHQSTTRPQPQQRPAR
eukprot:4677726-Prymnesium_polylepis.1